jgi:hypothetical protein
VPWVGRPASTITWSLQKDRCAACILARLASDADVLKAFKAGMLIRAKPDEMGEKSKRMLYVNAMIDRLPGEGDARRVHDDAEELGRSLQIMLKRWKRDQKALMDRIPLSPASPGDVEERAVAAREWARQVEEWERSQSSPGDEFYTRFNSAFCPSPLKDQDGLPLRKINEPEPYEPIPWRVEMAKSHNTNRDTIDDVIDQYRRATINSSPRLNKSLPILPLAHDDDEQDPELYTAYPVDPDSISPQEVNTGRPEYHHPESEIRSLKGSVRRTESIRSDQSDRRPSREEPLLETVLETGAYERKRSTTGRRPSKYSFHVPPPVPPPRRPLTDKAHLHVRESSVSDYSRVSSQMEGSFRYDKLNLGGKEEATPAANSRYPQQQYQQHQQPPQKRDDTTRYTRWTFLQRGGQDRQDPLSVGVPMVGPGSNEDAIENMLGYSARGAYHEQKDSGVSQWSGMLRDVREK